ncbi:uncharacterized protein B0P05DRAFT_554992 [Gilbertella persicaria]|uniref:uncharacterized protein n=1 Tax=Gilbertella persicaria TaxID=101096 RepID=UPI00221E38DB|nr:uncharacterized protein B0P05DRAFT_554992 [Gilbertella persicaria]KAI8064328.1 hypothetical protein B0P05DRAFT_554992 [Gilbertella persicaria]
MQNHIEENTNASFSPQSTEKILFDYLKHQFVERNQQEQNLVYYQENQNYNTIIYAEQQQLFSTAIWDDNFMSLEEEQDNIVIQLNNFSDLQTALKDIEELETHPTSSSLRVRAQNRKSKCWSTTEGDLVNLSSAEFTLPPSIQLNIESLQIIDILIDRAVKHWCCIGFRVAPISVDMIKDWRRAPRAIVYCIASITLVSHMEHQSESDISYSKQLAFVLYEQARKNVGDILVDDMQPIIIQSYFCLSYTSNLLRLYEQQRTWGGLASISLQHLATAATNTKKASAPSLLTYPTKTLATINMDEAILGCWFRWYYIDAWMCLTLNRDCLLPGSVPWLDMQQVERISLQKPKTDPHQLYSFAVLAHYMRRYIRALQSGRLFAFQTTMANSPHRQQRVPSKLYYEITQGLTQWYAQLPKHKTIAELHFHLCYNSVRLIVLYQFLHPQFSPPHDILTDCLLTNLELLEALIQLKKGGCDQSTYHHMFFAIHNTAKRIFQYNIAQFKYDIEEQFKTNLILLKSTQAYAHDVFKMKMYAKDIEDQLNRMNITVDFKKYEGNTFVFKQNQTHSNDIHRPMTMPQLLPPSFLPLFQQRKSAESSNAYKIFMFKQQTLEKHLKKSFKKKKVL